MVRSGDRPELGGAVGLVTGASSGIGRAIVRALAEEGMRLHLVGRRGHALEQLAPGSVVHVADLVQDTDLGRVIADVRARETELALLVHAAGLFLGGGLEEADPEDLDEQLSLNLRAPWVLTRGLLPALRRAPGQIVVVNSSAGVAPTRGGYGAYSASKHALRAWTESLREEVNPDGIRVLSVYPGRTATPMQKEVVRFEGREYREETLLQPEDVAEAILHALRLPRRAELTDLHLRPMQPG